MALWCLLGKKPSKLLVAATQLLSKCEDLRAEVYEERRLAQSRQRAAIGLWKKSGALGFGFGTVHNNPLAKGSETPTLTPRNNPLQRATSAVRTSSYICRGAIQLYSRCTSFPQTKRRVSCTFLTRRSAQVSDSGQDGPEKVAAAREEAARVQAVQLGPIGALEAWNILYTYQAKNETRCACQMSAVMTFGEAQSRKNFLASQPPEKTPPDADLYSVVLEMVSVLELTDDEEFEADLGTRIVLNPQRWTCRPRFNRLQGGAGSTPLLQCLIRASAPALHHHRDLPQLLQLLSLPISRPPARAQSPPSRPLRRTPLRPCLPPDTSSKFSPASCWTRTGGGRRARAGARTLPSKGKTSSTSSL